MIAGVAGGYPVDIPLHFFDAVSLRLHLQPFFVVPQGEFAVVFSL